jgi:hypothetical protein
MNAVLWPELTEPRWRTLIDDLLELQKATAWPLRLTIARVEDGDFYGARASLAESQRRARHQGLIP